MDFYLELFLTSLISLLIAFLLGKLAADDRRPEDDSPAADRSAAARPAATAGHGGEPESKDCVGVGEAEVGGGGLDRVGEVVGAGNEGDLAESSAGSGGVEFGSDYSTLRGGEEMGVRGGDLDGARVLRDDGVGLVVGGVVMSGGEEEVGVGRVVGSIGAAAAAAAAGGGVGEGEVVGGGEGEVGSLLLGEDEWEGIERSELEKLFAVATEYVGGEEGGEAVSKLSHDVQMQLYGLQKVATEGPCYESQPMALKVSSRAKWYVVWVIP